MSDEQFPEQPRDAGPDPETPPERNDSRDNVPQRGFDPPDGESQRVVQPQAEQQQRESEAHERERQAAEQSDQAQQRGDQPQPLHWPEQAQVEQQPPEQEPPTLARLHGLDGAQADRR
jgi:hypothetical protein